ncbi:MAG: nitroreductase family protein [Mycoplasma sp.]
MLEKMLHRTSVRDYTDEKINENILNNFKNIINAAPTSINGHQFSTIFIQNKEIKKNIAENNWNQKHIEDAPLFVLFMADLNAVEKCQIESKIKTDNSTKDLGALTMGTIDATIAATMLHDYAISIGLGCCFIGGVRIFTDKLISMLNIKGTCIPVLGLTIGYVKKENTIKPKLDKTFNEVYDLELFNSRVSSYDETMKNYYYERDGVDNNFYLNTAKTYRYFEKISENTNKNHKKIFTKLS